MCGVKKKIWAAVLCGLVLLMCCAATACRSRAEREKAQANVPEFVLTYAENQAEDYPTTQGAYKFAELVYERTGGKIEIQVNAGGVLGDEKTVIEQLQFGGVDFARVSLSPLAEFVPKLNVLQMPYLYTGREHMWKVRVQESELMKDTIEALGATPVPAAYGEVYSGLQTGKIDGAENNWPSYESTRHYEVAKYYTLDEHTRVPELQLAAQPTWDKLSPEYRSIIKECALESAKYERQLWAAREKISENFVRNAGCVVTELTPREKARFQEAVAPMYEKYCSDYVDIINAIMEAGKAMSGH